MRDCPLMNRRMQCPLWNEGTEKTGEPSCTIVFEASRSTICPLGTGCPCFSNPTFQGALDRRLLRSIVDPAVSNAVPGIARRLGPEVFNARLLEWYSKTLGTLEFLGQLILLSPPREAPWVDDERMYFWYRPPAHFRSFCMRIRGKNGRRHVLVIKGGDLTNDVVVNRFRIELSNWKVPGTTLLRSARMEFDAALTLQNLAMETLGRPLALPIPVSCTEITHVRNAGGNVVAVENFMGTDYAAATAVEMLRMITKYHLNIRDEVSLLRSNETLSWDGNRVSSGSEDAMQDYRIKSALIESYNLEKTAPLDPETTLSYVMDTIESAYQTKGMGIHETGRLLRRLAQDRRALGRQILRICGSLGQYAYVVPLSFRAEHSHALLLPPVLSGTGVLNEASLKLYNTGRSLIDIAETTYRSLYRAYGLDFSPPVMCLPDFHAPEDQLVSRFSDDLQACLSSILGSTAVPLADGWDCIVHLVELYRLDKRMQKKGAESFGARYDSLARHLYRKVHSDRPLPSRTDTEAWAKQVFENLRKAFTQDETYVCLERIEGVVDAFQSAGHTHMAVQRYYRDQYVYQVCEQALADGSAFHILESFVRKTAETIGFVHGAGYAFTREYNAGGSCEARNINIDGTIVDLDTVVHMSKAKNIRFFQRKDLKEYRSAFLSMRNHFVLPGVNARSRERFLEKMKTSPGFDFPEIFSDIYSRTYREIGSKIRGIASDEARNEIMSILGHDISRFFQ